MKRTPGHSARSAPAPPRSPPPALEFTINLSPRFSSGPPNCGVPPPPPLLFPGPMMPQRPRVSRPPLYLRVPPGHARDWRRYCHRYGACGERVYFVQDNWYRHEYAPHYQERHIHRDYGRDGYRDDYRRHERRDHRDDYRGEERGRDRGRGDDHGRGHGHDH